MVLNSTYAKLEQRVRAIEKAEAEHKQAEKNLKENEE